jgi:hypothetical protein
MRALWLRKVAAGAWPKAHLRASRLNVSSGALRAVPADKAECRLWVQKGEPAMGQEEPVRMRS